MLRILLYVCTLAIYFQTSAAYPIVVAANRDEFYARPATSPARLTSEPWIVAGVDAVAGGTWLGVNRHALVAGLLNRRTSTPPDPTRRSRGLLCLDVLHQPSVAAGATLVCRDQGTRYNPFNLLLASPDAACVIGNVSGSMVRARLDPGLHLLTNLELNDTECPRIAKSYGLFDEIRLRISRLDIKDLVSALRRILSDHSTPLDPRADGPPNNLCVHSEHYGTRSSTLLVYSAHERAFRMWHADGAPCRTPFAEVALPLGAASSQKSAGQV